MINVTGQDIQNQIWIRITFKDGSNIKTNGQIFMKLLVLVGLNR